MPPKKHTLGSRIRAARERAGLTLEEAAAIAGIPYQRWQDCERGIEPKALRLFAIADALGVETDALRPKRRK